MKKCILFLISLLIFGSGTIFGQSVKKHFDRNNVCQAESDFSKVSKEKGFKVACPIFAADDAIVFRPLEVNAKEWANKLEDSVFGITWYSSFADISAAGDLGYSTGPFENRYDRNDSSKVVLGQYATVWKRQPDGTLKFIMDFGTNVLPASFKFIKESPFQFNEAPEHKMKTPKKNTEKEEQGLLEIEKKFSDVCKTSGDIAAYNLYGSKDIRFFYQREFYLHGLDAVIATLSLQKGVHEWHIKKITMAESGDLAHVYGTHQFIENGVIKEGYFMRIWKKEPDKWTIVLQVRSITALPKVN